MERGGKHPGPPARPPSFPNLVLVSSGDGLPPQAPLTVLGRRGEAHSWLRVTPTGEVTVVQLDKHAVAASTSVPLRDLRLLEAAIASTSATALLPRQRALVVR